MMVTICKSTYCRCSENSNWWTLAKDDVMMKMMYRQRWP